jgi:hypothetical protein
VDRESEATATAILIQLTEDFPGVPDYRHQLAQVYSVRTAHDSWESESAKIAIDRYLKAVDLMEDVVAKHPHIPTYQASLADVLHKLGIALDRDKQHGKAADQLVRSVRIQSGLVKRFDDALGYKLWLAVYQHRLSEILTHGGKYAQARTILTGTAAILSDLIKQLPQKDADLVEQMLNENRRRTEALPDDDRT